MRRGPGGGPGRHPRAESRGRPGRLADRRGRAARRRRTSPPPGPAVSSGHADTARTPQPLRGVAHLPSPPSHWTPGVLRIRLRTRYRRFSSPSHDRQTCKRAFHGTDLDLRLRRRGVTQVVLGGVATSIGVESTARSAYEHGYHVTLATDAMTDMDAEAHRNSVEKIFPRLGEADSADAILALLG
ncbi:isochorismatase family protein [Streptomyces sp. NPDC005322]|uniref:isochorismatase family protein n=1 Tax=Streptomyces sp. NPDC005322 TaxID=3157032 RepID=UPI00339FB316